ncbi:MAG: OmpH family outer membrane protein [Pseudomonadota bacterium]
MVKKLFFILGLMSTVGLNAAELKIGFVNVPRLLEKAPQAESAKKDLEREFSPRDKRLVAEQKEIQQLEGKLSRDAAVMSETERRKMEREILNKRREAKRAQEEFTEDFNIRRNEELGKLQRHVFEAIRSLAKEENYDLLLTDGVVYASEQIDVTAKVQQKLVDRFKGKK